MFARWKFYDDEWKPISVYFYFNSSIFKDKILNIFMIKIYGGNLFFFFDEKDISQKDISQKDISA